jgi:hypothetical protein
MQNNNIENSNGLNNYFFSKETKRKRGRPLKKNDNDKSDKNKNSEKNKIILHLPINIANVNLENNLNNDIFDLKINNNDNFLFSMSDNNEKIQQLKQEIKKKDELIVKLSNDVNNINYENVECTNKNSIKIIKIKSLDEQCNISCWWCTYDFNDMPCYIPDRYYDNAYYVFGYFCSFNCTIAYNMHMNDSKVYHRHSLIHMLYKSIFKNEDLVNINIAPPKEVLKKYGGTIDIEEYRKNMNVLKKDNNLTNSPQSLSIIPYFEGIKLI